MKLSIITITARDNYPYIGRPELHLFEPTIESLKSQTIDKKDIEWVIVDYLYEERKDYFKDMNLPFKVKHVPAAPNIWHDVGLPGVSTQYNKGIIYADGELLYFSGDGYMFLPDFCEKLWNYHKQGYIPLVWYFFDNTYTDTVSPETFKISHPIDTEAVQYDIKYNICGYNGNKITIEHRPVVAFKENNQIYNAPWEWWFCCSATPLEAMLKINGFDTKFDGDRTLLDCDVGSRLQLAGYNKFGLFKDLFAIRPGQRMTEWNAKLTKDTRSIKCNLPLIHLSRHHNRFRANDYILIDEDIKWMKEEYCGQQCLIRERCRTEHPLQYPFEHKSQKKLYDYWFTHQGKINLAEERQKRLAGDKQYAEGTFT